MKSLFADPDLGLWGFYFSLRSFVSLQFGRFVLAQRVNIKNMVIFR